MTKLTKKIVAGRCVVVIDKDGITIYEDYRMMTSHVKNEIRRSDNYTYIWLLQRLAKGDGSNRVQKVPYCNHCNVIRKQSTRLGWHCPKCSNPFNTTRLREKHWEWKFLDNFKFDSGPLVLLDEGVVEVICNTCQAGYNISDKEMCNPYSCTHGCRWRWLSEVCRLEYEYCKEHHIEVRSLQHPEIVL